MKVMLDLETLSTKKNAAIAAIGAVGFTNTGVSDQSFYRVIKLQSCEDLGLHISASTVGWWVQQDAQARAMFADKGAVSLTQALADFTGWYASISGDEVWGNGSDFDNVILTSAYDAVKIARPWMYHQDRCFRTLKNLPRKEVYDAAAAQVPTVVKHNALDDAAWQAAVAVRLFSALGI